MRSWVEAVRSLHTQGILQHLCEAWFIYTGPVWHHAGKESLERQGSCHSHTSFYRFSGNSVDQPKAWRAMRKESPDSLWYHAEWVSWRVGQTYPSNLPSFSSLWPSFGDLRRLLCGWGRWCGLLGSGQHVNHRGGFRSSTTFLDDSTTWTEAPSALHYLLACWFPEELHGWCYQQDLRGCGFPHSEDNSSCITRSNCSWRIPSTGDNSRWRPMWMAFNDSCCRSCKVWGNSEVWQWLSIESYDATTTSVQCKRVAYQNLQWCVGALWHQVSWKHSPSSGGTCFWSFGPWVDIYSYWVVDSLHLSQRGTYVKKDIYLVLYLHMCAHIVHVYIKICIII